MKYLIRISLPILLILVLLNGTSVPVSAIAQQVTPNTIKRVNVGRYDVPTTLTGSSQNPSVTSNGQLFVFESSSVNSTNNTDNNGVNDILLYDMQTDKVKYISVSSSGQLSNRVSKNPVISGNGQYVAFISDATNLGNGNSNIYIHHIPTAQTNRVNILNAVGSVNALDSIDLSHDGRYLVFASINSTLVPDDTNNKADVFLYDTHMNDVTRVSVNSDGIQANDTSSQPKIAGNGQVIVFASKALNLVSNHNGKTMNIYAYDVPSGQTTLVSHVPSEPTSILYAPWAVGYPTDITYDGRYVTFSIGIFSIDAFSPRLSTFHIDRQTNITTYISDMESVPTGFDFESAPSADVSEDGTVVLFVAIFEYYSDFPYKFGMIYKHNLVTGVIESIFGDHHLAPRTVDVSDNLEYIIFGTENNAIKEIYIRNQQTRTQERMRPLTEIRPQANEDSYLPQISDDGQIVAFASSATNLIPLVAPYVYSGIFVYDARQDTLRYVSLTLDRQRLDMYHRFYLTADGKRVIYEGDTYGTIYYIYDLETDEISQLILTPQNNMPLSIFGIGAISYDARFMVIGTPQSLLPEDTNQQGDAYWYDHETGEVQLISRTFTGTLNNGFSFNNINMTPDGRYVNYITPMPNIVEGVNGYHSYVYDSHTQQNTLASKSPDGAPVSRIVDYSKISPNGRYVVFVLKDSYIINNISFSGPKIFLHDREQSTTILLTDGFMRQFRPGVDFTSLYISSISNEYALIITDRNNANFNDNNDVRDLYFFNLITGKVSRFMPDMFIQPGFGQVTPSNQYIVFSSLSDQLVPNDTNNKADIFVAQINLPVNSVIKTNEQQLFNAMQPHLIDGMTFAMFDITPTGIITTVQFSDGGVVTATITMTTENGLITITLNGLLGGTSAQQQALYDYLPSSIMTILDEVLPDDYVAIESLTLTDSTIDVTVMRPNNP